MGGIPSILFYATADTNYKDFVIPFMYFALVTNENSFAEVHCNFVDEDLKNKVIELNKIFGAPRASLYSYSSKVRPDTYRYLVKPNTKTDYVYISDVDIITLDSDVLQQHLNMMRETHLCFSNIVRPVQNGKEGLPRRCSGIQLVETKKWYTGTKEVRESLPSNVIDEFALFEINKSICPELETLYLYFRPVHGFHLSMNRDPTPMHWGIKMPYFVKFQQIKKLPSYRLFLELVSENFIKHFESCDIKFT